MEDGTTADDRLPDVVRIPQVADHLRDVEAVEVPRVGAALDQRDDVLVPGNQLTGDGGADEPARAGDEDPVARLEIHRRALWNVPLAIVLPNSKIRLDPCCALDRTSSRASSEELDLVVTGDQRGQQLDDVHVVRRHLGEDVVPMEQREHDHL